MEEPVEDATGGGHVAEQFAPFLQWAVAGTMVERFSYRKRNAGDLVDRVAAEKA